MSDDGPQLDEGVDEVEVVVIGGGLSGLMAARRLTERDVDVVVLEANDRVGGRLRRTSVRGESFDLGGQWIGARHSRLAELAAELGMETFPTWHNGKKLLDLDGRLTTQKGLIPKLALWHLWVLHRALQRSDMFRRMVPLDSPWEAARGTQWDGVTVEQMKRELRLTAPVSALFDVSVRTVFGAEPSEVSALYFLFYMNSNGGLRRVIEIEDGAQERRFIEGAGAVPERMAAQLSERVVTSAVVLRLADDGDRVRVETTAGVFSARLAIVAVPPAQAARIVYDPPLPPGRRALLEGARMGYTAKTFAFYERAFWRDAGFSGEAVAAGRSEGPLTFVVDNTSWDGAVPCLLGFRVGAPGRAAPQGDALREAAIRQLVRYFGPQAAHPVDFIDHDWSQEAWAGGCPVAGLPPGLLTGHGQHLREPLGNLHWAGTETAEDFCGYMEGALEAGLRAAEEVLSRL